MAQTVAIIPARYASTRFPGKPLVEICGRSMIERVYRSCRRAQWVDKVVVATDSVEILQHCQAKKMAVVMTSENCLTGTDRVFEAAQKFKGAQFINVQGDEPMISPSDIDKVVLEGRKFPTEIVNGYSRIESEEEFFNVNVPKVLVTPERKLLYMGRAPMPFNKEKLFKKALKQVCIYSFPLPALKDFYHRGEKTPLEAIEDIEILRFLELGYTVRMVEVSGCSLAVDVPEDVAKVEKCLIQMKKKARK